MAPKPRTFNLYGEYDMTYYDISVMLDKSTAAVRQAINEQFGGDAQEYLASLGLRDAESIKALMERNEAKARAEEERARSRAERIREEEVYTTREAIDKITNILLDADVREREAPAEPEPTTESKARNLLNKLNALIDLIGDDDICEIAERDGLDLRITLVRMKAIRAEEYSDMIDWEEIARRI